MPFGGGTPGKPGAAGDVTADLVFGQGAGKTFNTGFCNGSSGFVLSALTLCGPAGLSVDPFGTLFVADTLNNRVLAYNESANPPTNVTSQLEFGQGTTGIDFTHNGVNAGGLSANSLNLTGNEDGVANNLNGDLYVADSGNRRLLLYYGGFLAAPTPTPTRTPTSTPTPKAL